MSALILYLIKSSVKHAGAEHISYLTDMSGQETLEVIFSTSNIPVPLFKDEKNRNNCRIVKKKQNKR